MFPTANATVYRNEDGEVLGWDTHYEDAPDPDEFYDSDREAPEPKDTAECIKWNMHFNDGDGTDVDDVWECAYCSGKYTYDESREYGDPHRTILVTDEQYLVLRALQPTSREDEPHASIYDQVHIPFGTRSEDLPPQIDDNTGYTDRDFI